jgi:predicted RNA polymerase sigma factor
MGTSGSAVEPASMQELLDRVYRQNAGALTASLTRLLGPRRLDAVEAVLHDTFVAALEAWRESGAPQNPAAWLTTLLFSEGCSSCCRPSRAWARPRRSPCGR